MGSQAPKGSLQSKCWVLGALCIHVCKFVHDDDYTCIYCTYSSVSTTLNRLGTEHMYAHDFPFDGQHPIHNRDGHTRAHVHCPFLCNTWKEQVLFHDTNVLVLY